MLASFAQHSNAILLVGAETEKMLQQSLCAIKEHVNFVKENPWEYVDAKLAEMEVQCNYQLDMLRGGQHLQSQVRVFWRRLLAALALATVASQAALTTSH